MVQFNQILTWSSLATMVAFTLAVPIPSKPLIRIPLHKRPNGLARRDGSYESLFFERSEFYADIQVGTPSQNFSVVLDTGSDKLWIQGADCSHEYCHFGRYDHTKSSTAVDAHSKLNISYYDGSGAFGEFYYDTVTLAGLTIEKSLVGESYQNGSLGLGNNVSHAHPEGLMGLSFPSKDPETNKTQTPFVFQLYEQKKIEDPVFSFYYGDITKTGYDTGAEVVLGGVDSEKYTEEIEYTPVVPTVTGEIVYWQSYAQSFKIANPSDTLIVWNATTELAPATFDSGTTSILLPEPLSRGLYLSLTGLQQPQTIVDPDTNETFWQIDCGYANSTDYSIEIGLSHYKDKTEIDDAPLVLSVPASSFVLSTEGICIWRVQTGDDLLLGQRYLQNFYTVHNMKTREIGFAPAINKDSKVYIDN